MNVVRKDLSKPSALSVAQREMRAGERLIWADRPAPGRHATGMMPLALFGLIFGGIASFWMSQAMKTSRYAVGEFPHFLLFGLPFVLVGLGLFLSPAWAWLGARKTVYAISSDRLLIIRRGKARSFAPDEIEDLDRDERPDGSGDLVFRRD